MLEDFEVKKLGRLNLIVGKNNSGKSSVLEAIRIYAGNGNIKLLTEIANEHDEKYSITDDKENNVFPFEAFFTGRRFPAEDGKAILIGECDKFSKALQIQHVYLRKIEESLENEVVRSQRWQSITKSEIQEKKNEDIYPAIRLLKNEKALGHVLLKDSSRRVNFLLSEDQENDPCSYISTKFIAHESLSDDWDKISLTDHEEYIKTALKFIEKDFENITFVKKDSEDRQNFVFSNTNLVFSNGHPNKRFAKVKLSSLKQPIPLNSMGDGMLRILQLALKVYPAKGGFLLIDEFENGLHYSVQEKIWEWLFELASHFDFQVFATTHSWDCVESFSQVAQKRKGQGVLFRVGRSVITSDNGKVIATEFDEEKLAIIKQADVEVR